MGLAPYGTPKFRNLILERLLDLKEDGSFRLDLSYFDYCAGLRMTNDKFDALFGGPPRKPEDRLTQRDMDLAASVQAVTEEVMCRLTRSLAAETNLEHLALAGGVALNCVANGKILRDGAFRKVWIQPAAGDAGGAVGAALATYHLLLRQPRRVSDFDGMTGSFLGPAFQQSDIERHLRSAGARFSVLSDQALIDESVSALTAGQALGWFQGRMEFGPRALGARSILGDPRSPTMQKTLNLRVKHRESFRPFAPAILRENVAEWFELQEDSPYMLLVADVRKDRRRPLTSSDETLVGIEKVNAIRSEIPAVTHVDYSARIQTVDSQTNRRFHALLRAFRAATGCPVLVNTSFNVRGEPIVCTPADAFRCFMVTDIEALAIGNCFLRKGCQDPALRSNYEEELQRD
jgi:carbamoyltransferase